jgi:hypothetical protein
VDTTLVGGTIDIVDQASIALPGGAVAHHQSVTTAEDTPVVITLTANDPEGDPLTYQIVANPADGSLSGTPPSLIYTPDADFNGFDKFTFKVNDGTADSNPAIVLVRVTSTNDAPVANDDSAQTTKNTPVAIDVAANDTDIDGNLDPTTANTVCGTCSSPSNGSLVNNLDGTFDYTPGLDYSGPDSFVYEICDSFLPAKCDTATVTIAVTSPPVANDDSASTPEETLVTVDVAANDTDADGDLDPTTTNTACGTCSSTTDGSLVNNGNGSFDYTPNVDFNGSDGFVYEICDTVGACDTATVTITVTAVNDLPVAVDDGYATDEDVTLNVGAPGVLDNTPVPRTGL